MAEMRDFFIDGKEYYLPQILIHNQPMAIIYKDELNKDNKLSKYVNFKIEHALDYFKGSITVDMSKEIVMPYGINKYEIGVKTMSEFIENPDKYYLEFCGDFNDSKKCRETLIKYNLIGKDELTEYDIHIKEGNIGFITNVDKDRPFVDILYWISVSPKTNKDETKPVMRKGSILLSKILVSNHFKIVKYLR